jgi:hypothetical protein
MFYLAWLVSRECRPRTDTGVLNIFPSNWIIDFLQTQTWLFRTPLQFSQRSFVRSTETEILYAVMRLRSELLRVSCDVGLEHIVEGQLTRTVVAMTRRVTATLCLGCVGVRFLQGFSNENIIVALKQYQSCIRILPTLDWEGVSQYKRVQHCHAVCMCWLPGMKMCLITCAINPSQHSVLFCNRAFPECSAPYCACPLRMRPGRPLQSGD